MMPVADCRPTKVQEDKCVLFYIMTLKLPMNFLEDRAKWKPQHLTCYYWGKGIAPALFDAVKRTWRKVVPKKTFLVDLDFSVSQRKKEKSRK